MSERYAIHLYCEQLAEVREIWASATRPLTSDLFSARRTTLKHGDIMWLTRERPGAQPEVLRIAISAKVATIEFTPADGVPKYLLPEHA